MFGLLKKIKSLFKPKQIYILTDDAEKDLNILSGVVRSLWAEKRFEAVAIGSNVLNARVIDENGAKLGEILISEAHCNCEDCDARYVVVSHDFSQDLTDALVGRLQERFEKVFVG